MPRQSQAPTKLHGGVFEFIRNDKLDARNFFSKTRAILKRNQFGGDIGGPLQFLTSTAEKTKPSSSRLRGSTSEAGFGRHQYCAHGSTAGRELHRRWIEDDLRSSTHSPGSDLFVMGY